jgi:hypothetical protein
MEYLMAASITSLQQLQDCSNRGASGTADPCGWKELIILVNQIVGFATYLAISFSVLGFAYAGWLFLSAGGNASSRQKAKSIMLNCVLGIVFILISYLIVQFVVKNLGLNPDYSMVKY